MASQVVDQRFPSRKEFAAWVQQQPHAMNKPLWLAFKVVNEEQGAPRSNLIYAFRKQLVEFMVSNLSNSRSWRSNVMPLLGDLLYRREGDLPEEHTTPLQD